MSKKNKWTYQRYGIQGPGTDNDIQNILGGLITMRTKMLVKYALMLEKIPVKGNDYYEMMQYIRYHSKKINNLREKLLMPESYYPFKQP